MDVDLAVAKALVFFGENWSYVTGRILPPVGPYLVNIKFKVRGQTKSDPHEKYKKGQAYPAQIRVARFHP